MRSSEGPRRAWPWQPAALAFAVLGLAACTAVTAPMAPAAAAACPQSKVPGIEELQRSVEAEPLYAAASSSGLASCRVGEEEGGAYALTYVFRDGSRLLARRDARIEYSEREVHLASPPAGDPLAILQRAERAAFGAAGCGIDWQAIEQQAAKSGERGATDSVYRGATCNCQARVRRDGAGRVIGFALRSSC